MSRWCAWAEDKNGNGVAEAWTFCKKPETAIRRLERAMTTKEYYRTTSWKAIVPSEFDVDFVPAGARTIFLDR